MRARLELSSEFYTLNASQSCPGSNKIPHGLAGAGAALGAIFGGLEQAEWERHLSYVSEAYVAYDVERALAERFGALVTATSGDDLGPVGVEESL